MGTCSSCFWCCGRSLQQVWCYQRTQQTSKCRASSRNCRQRWITTAASSKRWWDQTPFKKHAFLQTCFSTYSLTLWAAARLKGFFGGGHVGGQVLLCFNKSCLCLCFGGRPTWGICQSCTAQRPLLNWNRYTSYCPLQAAVFITLNCTFCPDGGAAAFNLKIWDTSKWVFSAESFILKLHKQTIILKRISSICEMWRRKSTSRHLCRWLKIKTFNKYGRLHYENIPTLTTEWCSVAQLVKICVFWMWFGAELHRGSQAVWVSGVCEAARIFLSWRSVSSHQAEQWPAATPGESPPLIGSFKKSQFHLDVKVQGLKQTKGERDEKGIKEQGKEERMTNKRGTRCKERK